MTSSWYVLHTKPKKETLVFRYLQAQEIDVFYPSVRVKPVNPRSLKIRPLFPRYMFVKADLDQVGVSALRWIPNAIGLVEFGGLPAPVSEHVVREIMQRVDQIQAAGGLTLDGLKKGDSIRITNGPLAGYEALFDMRLSGNERVQVLLEMMGQLVKVKVRADAIEKTGH